MSSDGSSDSDSEAGDALQQQIAELERKLYKNPYLYDDHIQYISCLRQEGHLAKVRHARERMHKYFPLSQELWQQWIHDEAPMAADREAVQNVLKLYRRAVQDYLCADLWLELVQFASSKALESTAAKQNRGSGGDGDDDEENEEAPTVTVDEARQVFEDAVVAIGKHFTKASSLWESYVQFELSLLQRTQETADTDPKAVEAQQQRLEKLFARWVAVPLPDLEVAWAVFEDWCKSSGISPSNDTVRLHKQATAEAETLQALENQLEQAQRPRWQTFREIIEKQEQRKQPPDVVCLLFERAAEEEPLNPAIWQEYGQFLETQCSGAHEQILSVYERAVRNCPWSHGLWQSRMTAMERAARDYTEIKHVLEDALQAGFSTVEQYVDLWLAFVRYVARQIDAAAADGREEAVSLWRDMTDTAAQYVVAMVSKGDERGLTIPLYKARVEANKLGNTQSARAVFDELTKELGFGARASAWLAYADFEKQHGSPEQVRWTYKTAVNYVTDDAASVAQAWLDYESDFGDLKHLDLAVQRCRKQLSILAQRQQQALVQSAQQASDQQEALKKKAQKGKQKRQDQPPAKKKGAAEKSGKRGPMKRKAGSEDTGDEEQQERHVKRAKQDGRNETADMDVSEQGQGPSHGEGSEAGDFHKSFDPEKAGRTVVVKNLDFQVDEATLRDAFASCGEVAEVRVVRKQTGKSKGYAFVEFADAKSVTMALSKDNHFLQGRPMYVDRCVDRSKTGLGFKYDTGLEERKLFVKNVDYSATEEELMELFSQAGTVSDVRIGTHRSGKRRGFAYIEFERAQDAREAVIRLDNHVFKERPLSVALSNPPKKGNAGGGAAGGQSSTAGGMSGEARTTKLGKQMSTGSTSASLVPRSLGSGARSRGKTHARARLAVAGDSPKQETPQQSTDTNQQADAQGNQETKKPKSNADFRALIMSGKTK